MGRKENIQGIIRHKKTIDDLLEQKNRQLAHRFGLRLEQYKLLIQLKEIIEEYKGGKEGPTVGEIAKKLNKSQNTMSEQITRLEKKELLKRGRDSKDRRINRVYITKKSDELLENMENQAEKTYLAHSLQKLSDEKILILHKCLEELLDCMKS
ncbi:MAG: MarR family transcriptional regulator [Anaeromicrobium sp.]|uniref:MarR family winged helix-turn-helix transcriptional regulator n=1 Tax=Anaeromicrobium sp. TaxID=1929132 RepID=UPI0025E36DCB|nr:MarR family transcriptional regulator [Anaeromicrobium sp.]MCT4596127.1 MarR family transcriptional regulator [Anaeromicrobium sp.]